MRWALGLRRCPARLPPEAALLALRRAQVDGHGQHGLGPQGLFHRRCIEFGLEVGRLQGALACCISPHVPRLWFGHRRRRAARGCLDTMIRKCGHNRMTMRRVSQMGNSTSSRVRICSSRRSANASYLTWI